MLLSPLTLDGLPSMFPITLILGGITVNVSHRFNVSQNLLSHFSPILAQSHPKVRTERLVGFEYGIWWFVSVEWSFRSTVCTLRTKNK